MQTKPLFSVIIPAYNVQDFIGKCLDSVLNQTAHNYEIILIDDGSSDNTSQICVEYAMKYLQINLLKQPNQGVSVARNRGIQLAHGEYVLFIDGDDGWENNHFLADLEKIVQQNPNVDLILYHFFLDNVKTQQQRQIERSFHHLTGHYINDFNTLIERGLYNSSACTKAIRRQLIVQNQLQFPPQVRFEDFAFCFDLALHIQNYQIYPHAIYRYSIGRSESATSHVTLQTVLDYFKVLSQKLNTLEYLQQTKSPFWRSLLLYWTHDFGHFKKRFECIHYPIEKAKLAPDIQHCVARANHLLWLAKQPAPKKRITLTTNH